MTPEERKAYNAAHYQANREKRLAQQAERAKNPVVRDRRNELARQRAAADRPAYNAAVRERASTPAMKAWKQAYDAERIASRDPAEHNAAQKRYRDSNPEKRFWARMLYTYGLTQTAFWELWTDQNGQCPCCHCHMSLVPRKGNSVCVDHKHDETKQVRSLLCLRCNSAVGQVLENPAIARGVAAYLEGA